MPACSAVWAGCAVFSAAQHGGSRRTLSHSSALLPSRPHATALSQRPLAWVVRAGLLLGSWAACLYDPAYGDEDLSVAQGEQHVGGLGQRGTVGLLAWGVLAAERFPRMQALDMPGCMCPRGCPLSRPCPSAAGSPAVPRGCRKKKKKCGKVVTFAGGGLRPQPSNTCHAPPRLRHLQPGLSAPT